MCLAAHRFGDTFLSSCFFDLDQESFFFIGTLFREENQNVPYKPRIQC